MIDIIGLFGFGGKFLPEPSPPNSSREPEYEQEETLAVFAPINASVAQGLLQVVLENAHIEKFSPSGGGVLVMLLEQSQIELLKIHGVFFNERSQPIGAHYNTDGIVESSNNPLDAE